MVFDVERHLSSEVIEFVENFFVLLGRDHMMVEPSSHRDEKEYAPEGDILGSENVCDIPNFFLVELGNGGIDLDFQADLPCIPNRVHGPNEAAIHAAESIVIFTIVAVQADSEADQARLLHSADRWARHFPGASRHHRHAQTDFGPVTDYVENVGTLEGVSPGDDEKNGPESSGLIEKGKSFFGGQFSCISAGAGLGTAMEAGEGAGLRHFPNNEEGGAVEIDRSEIGFWSRSLRRQGMGWQSTQWEIHRIRFLG